MIKSLLVLVVLVVVAYLIVKNYHPVLSLIIGAFVLLACAWTLGHPIYPVGEGTGFGLFDTFLKFKDIIITQVSSAGIVTITLSGYSGYMNTIGANQMAVNSLVKPLMKIKRKSLSVPVAFLIGSLMSLVAPSASSLAIILVSILYPMLTSMGISPLTATSVIAMTTTIMPTPLGADNVIAADTLGYDVPGYVVWNTKISLPPLLIIAVVQYSWQKHCDKREGEAAYVSLDEEGLSKQKEFDVSKLYAILPILPLLLTVGVGIAGMFVKGITMDTFVLTPIFLFIVVLVETLCSKFFKKVQDMAVETLKEMRQGFSQVVMLVVGGSLFTSAIQTLGIIDSIMASAEVSGSAGIVMTLIFSSATTLFGILSGGGLAMFHAVIELIPGVAEKAGIGGILISLPMQMTANLTRTIPSVAAVVMTVAPTVGASPIRILKRMSVPIIIGIISVIVLSILLLPY